MLPDFTIGNTPRIIQRTVWIIISPQGENEFRVKISFLVLITIHIFQYVRIAIRSLR